jgi:hypothetical protein
MALNPVETMNVFADGLSKELRKRSLSTNLVKTRTPFLRFTTAAYMDDVATRMREINSANAEKFANDITGYRGYKFFTLGVHGYEQLNYSIHDLYGTQGDNGLVIGTTYKQGVQKLVKTFGGKAKAGDTVAKNYPPPGITNAKVERLRNGNVLRFTIETQCYTQEQLEMLDMICFVPGMTCILEWGTQYSTSTNQEKLIKTLDFKNLNATVTSVEKVLGNQSRTSFIEEWCEPNGYNYDWAVANIANVKTVVQDNVYKTTIIAYGVADNLLYISAYATNNPLKTETDTSTSLTNYFRLNGEFSNTLRQYVTTPELLPNRIYRDQILKFTDDYNREQLIDVVPTSQNTGQVNDFGLEDSYFITMPFFIDLIINGPVKQIIESGLPNRLNQLIATTGGQDPIYVGYNESLRSTSPEVCIIYNKKARTSNAASAADKRNLVDQATTLDARNIGALKGLPNTNAANIQGSNTDKTSVFGVISTLNDNSFGSDINTPSGITPLTKGVYINSKAIQSAFINARTFMEGFETLLRNINSATENYWDLKLFFDDDINAYRILDDNVRTAPQSSDIYEFNKRLNNLDGDTIGPDVLNIELTTDYPKMLFSQLAVTGINGGTLNNIASSPDRKDVDFKLNTSVRDIFKIQIGEPQQTSEAGLNRPSTAILEFATGLSQTESGRLLAREGFSFVGPQFASTFGNYFASGVSGTVTDLIRGVFTSTNLLSQAEALDLKQRLSRETLTQQQSAAISDLFATRAKSIIRRNKQNEIERYEKAIDDAIESGVITDRFGRDVTNVKRVVREAIERQRDELISQIDSTISNVRR